MDPIEIIIQYRRFMRRVNYSNDTVRSYLSSVKSLLEWLVVPIDEVTSNVIFEYIGFLHNRRLRPKTINSYLNGIRRFYDYLRFEERTTPHFFIPNPLFFQDKIQNQTCARYLKTLVGKIRNNPADFCLKSSNFFKGDVLLIAGRKR